MTVIESNITINKPVESIYQFLEDMNNHQQLMPENIYNWTSTKDEAKFTIQNMAKLSLRISERIENKELTATPIEKPPFDLIIKWKLEAIDANSTAVKSEISADLNMMMKMLASGPLQKLVDHQTSKLKEILA
ncbi:SRPBCC family protein [Pedobacter flavus]|uniref:SRPBCC family protein n=1 Tax=Pedobacter flavus TaxID=3113906 RepID=A0ABU7H2B2_9SPHI|nr:SRPBCC family protein [Pedobacter sp. VNH31]MEE1885405.1 SRPBCC family protein [Pedobacter sp. VNH31]